MLQLQKFQKYLSHQIINPLCGAQQTAELKEVKLSWSCVCTEQQMIFKNISIYKFTQEQRLQPELVELVR